MRIFSSLKKASAALALSAFVLGNSSAWAARNRSKQAAPERVQSRFSSMPVDLVKPRFGSKPADFTPRGVSVVAGPGAAALPAPGQAPVPVLLERGPSAMEQLGAAPVLGQGAAAAPDLMTAGHKFFENQDSRPAMSWPVFVSAARERFSGLLASRRGPRVRRAAAAEAPLPANFGPVPDSPPALIAAVFSRALLSIKLSAALACAAVPAWAKPPAGGNYPPSNELFHQLIADPRETQLSVGYYRLDGMNMADAALGATWGMRRWYFGGDKDRAVQLNVAGMAYSQFKLSGSVNEFQTTDYFANLPIEFRRGKASGRMTLFHESSHLGDDYIRRAGSTGSRYSVEGLHGLLSLEPLSSVRLYGGGTYLLHRIPSVGPATLQGGFELASPEVSRLLPRWSAYLAQDFQSKEQNRWSVDSNTQLGFRIGVDGVKRVIRAYIGHFEGHSPFAQFRTRRVTYNSIGAGFYF